MSLHKLRNISQHGVVTLQVLVPCIELRSIVVWSVLIDLLRQHHNYVKNNVFVVGEAELSALVNCGNNVDVPASATIHEVVISQLGEGEESRNGGRANNHKRPFFFLELLGIHLNELP